MRVAVDIWGDGYVRIAHCVESTVGSGERRSSATVDECTTSVVVGEGTHLAPLLPKRTLSQCLRSVQCAEAA